MMNTSEALRVAFCRKGCASRVIPGGDEVYQPPIDGADLVLTIDSVIQHIAETRSRPPLKSQKRAQRFS